MKVSLWGNLIPVSAAGQKRQPADAACDGLDFVEMTPEGRGRPGTQIQGAPLQFGSRERHKRVEVFWADALAM